MKSLKPWKQEVMDREGNIALPPRRYAEAPTAIGATMRLLLGPSYSSYFRSATITNEVTGVVVTMRRMAKYRGCTTSDDASRKGLYPE